MKISNINLKYKFIYEDYFPIKICFGKEKDLLSFFGFYYQNTDLLEIGIDNSSNTINIVQLVLSTNYSLKKHRIPKVNLVENADELSINLKSHIDCDFFELIIYLDGFIVNLSKYLPIKYIDYNGLILGIDNKNNITSIRIENLDSSQINHIIKEINYN